jgi:hypothetical protein
MSWTTRACVVAASMAALIGSGELTDASALADEQQPQQHNVTYRARIDGVSRGATIVYNINDTQVETANPTMLPGRTFEANAVLADPQHAGMEVSIRWPYSANLHCEILVDDNITAQADTFVAPRLLPQENDPGYGKLDCGGALANAGATSAATGGNVVNNAPIAGPPAEAPPAQAPPG